MNFPLRTALAASNKFCMVVFSLSVVCVPAFACVCAAVCNGCVVKELAVSDQTMYNW